MCSEFWFEALIQSYSHFVPFLVPASCFVYSWLCRIWCPLFFGFYDLFEGIVGDFAKKIRGTSTCRKTADIQTQVPLIFAYTLWLDSLILRDALLIFEKFCTSVVAPWTNQTGEKSGLQFDKFKPKLLHFSFSWSRY